MESYSILDREDVRLAENFRKLSRNVILNELFQETRGIIFVFCRCKILGYVSGRHPHIKDRIRKKTLVHQKSILLTKIKAKYAYPNIYILFI